MARTIGLPGGVAQQRHQLARGLPVIAQLVGWFVCLAFLAWAARTAYLEGYVYEVPKGFSGDFVQTANLAFPWWFDGTNLFYGPIFVLEYRFLFATHALEAADFARLDFLLLGVAFACTWVALFGRQRPRLAIVVLAAWLAHHATIEALANTAHLELLELAAIALALLLSSQGRLTSAGAALGVAVATKTLPGLFLPYLALTARWRMLAGSVAVAGVLFLAVCWLQAIPPWQGAVALVDQGGNLTKMEFTEYAYTLRADVARILVGEGGALSAQQASVAIAVHFALAALAVGLVGLVLVRAHRLPQHDGLRFGLIAATMLVVAPSAHPAYYVFLLPGLTAGLAAVLDRRVCLHSALVMVGLAAGFVFSGFDQPFVVAQRVVGFGGIVPAHWLTWHLPTLALLVSMGSLAALLLTGAHEHPAGGAMSGPSRPGRDWRPGRAR